MDALVEACGHEMALERGRLAQAVASPGSSSQERERQKAIKRLRREIELADKGLNGAFDLFDRGVIDEGEFSARREVLSGRRRDAARELERRLADDPIGLAGRQLRLLDAAIDALGEDLEVLWKNRAIRAAIDHVSVFFGGKWEHHSKPRVEITLRQDV